MTSYTYFLSLKEENSLKMRLKNIKCEILDWIQLAYGRVQWRALVNIELRFPENNFTNSWTTINTSRNTLPCALMLWGSSANLRAKFSLFSTENLFVTCVWKSVPWYESRKEYFITHKDRCNEWYVDMTWSVLIGQMSAFVYRALSTLPPLM